ncbi:hypothetical protein SUGI_0869220 [Cryptomeria japonica]|nr:hypothetical protein SUGI_0869220 [Cryptomeria japonica]
MPVLRSGSCANIGQRKYMEDEHICVDNLSAYNLRRPAPAAAAFYGIFDGHSGGEASKYVKETILDLILDDPNFPNDVETAITNAFAATENGLRSAGILKAGTTALMVLVWGRTLFIANAGDCRAVLSRSGKHINMTTDHKPTNKDERLRIESRGGVISSDGYINGVNCQFGVSRGLGDWEFKLESVALNLLSPISADPELNTYELTQEDEFLIIASDGVWDVLKSDFAQEVVRKQLRLCNDPVKCSQELVRHALKEQSIDNLTVIVICFSSDPPPRMQSTSSSRLWKKTICHTQDTTKAQDHLCHPKLTIPQGPSTHSNGTKFHDENLASTHQQEKLSLITSNNKIITSRGPSLLPPIENTLPIEATTNTPIITMVPNTPFGNIFSITPPVEILPRTPLKEITTPINISTIPQDQNLHWSLSMTSCSHKVEVTPPIKSPIKSPMNNEFTPLPHDGTPKNLRNNDSPKGHGILSKVIIFLKGVQKEATPFIIWMCLVGVTKFAFQLNK